MWFCKKVILIPLVIAVIVAGSITGVVLAQDGNDSNSAGNTLMAKVAAILGIDQTKLEDAFAQAQKEIRDEALTNYLNKLVEEGKITQEEADQYQQWWNARPDALNKLGPGFEFGGRGRGFGPGCGMWMAPFQPAQPGGTSQ
jgi:hypothetical protein